MFRLFTKILPFFFIALAGSAFAQKQASDQNIFPKPEYYKPDKPIVCYAGQPLDMAVPRRTSVIDKINARTKGHSAQFDVTYIGFDNFPQAKEAFQFAVDTWSALVASPVIIRIEATYETLDDNVLGASFPGEIWRNFDNTPQWNVWYPVALAEKITGRELNAPDKFELVASFNNMANWYFDIANPDSISGTGKFDFATVVMHELAHGLGFFAFPDVDDNGIGTIGLDGFPMVYTTFIEDEDGNNIVSDIENESQELGDAMTSTRLFYQGYTNISQDVRLHAPQDFNAGSSVSHLNGNFVNTPHELMTSFIGSNEFIHDPGLALDMMQDYGWEFTYIIHEPLVNTEDTLQTFEVTANVTSDLGFDTTSLKLHYSTDAFAAMDSILQMIPTTNRNEYTATLPNPGKGTELLYYIEVIDDKLRRFTDPGQAPDFVTFGFRIDVDDSIPQIEHTPVSFILENETDVAISASITDFFIGVDTAYIEYSINDVNQASIAMLHDPETFSIYNGTIDLSGGINADDIIKYRIVAIDKSLAQNSSVHPVSGFHEIFVEGIEQPVTEYFNDFNNPTTDFLGDQFTVFTASGFTDGALHSIHPYGEAGLDNSINYITQLKIPIIIDADQHEMRFDEIVLVEPGEPGTVFGNSQFWDYVIVEGSINDGTTWRRLTLGYDSREYDVWDNLYTSRVNSENISTAVGNPTLFRERILDLTDNGLFDPGDTLLIRFRMFADEAAAGWGWAIDNLQIQGEIVAAVEDFLVSTDEFKIFPNPSFNGIYTISATFKKQPTEIRLTVLDMLGKVIMSSKKSGTSLVFNYRLDLSNQPPGIYFVIATLGDDNITRKLIKSQ